jgi:hypothetical protein
MARIWALVADRARERGAAVSAALACDVCATTVGVDGVGLSVLSRPGRLEPVYATDPVSKRLDDLQFTVGEGPCIEAFQEAGPVLVADLAAAGSAARWPGLASATVRGDARAVFAFPLQSGAIRVGVLGLYCLSPGRLGPEQLADALRFADVALLTLLDGQAAAARATSRPADGLTGDRAEVHQATGMISAQAGVTVEDALIRLRAFAFALDRPVAEVAHDVVARTLRFDP